MDGEEDFRRLSKELVFGDTAENLQNVIIIILIFINRLQPAKALEEQAPST